jgi:hypothetical protein
VRSPPYEWRPPRRRREAYVEIGDKARQQCPLRVFADVRERIMDVRFIPRSRHAHRRRQCLLSAISRHSCRAFDLNRADSRGMRLAVAYSPTRMVQSPSHRETGEKDVGVILFGDDLSNEGIPDVLIARNQPDRRGDGKVVEDFHALLIGDLRSSGRELRDIAFQITADLIVEKARAKAVIFSGTEHAMREQGDACVTRNLIGLLRSEADATEDSDVARAWFALYH